MLPPQNTPMPVFTLATKMTLNVGELTNIKFILIAVKDSLLTRFATYERSSTEATMAVEFRETGNLIGSDKVQGTDVYGAGKKKIGSIERVMIDKASGKVSYAVLNFGGFLGIGHDHYPLPWQSLKYNPKLRGYVTGLTEDKLKGAPKYSGNSSRS
jgi:hypothetical protein